MTKKRDEPPGARALYRDPRYYDHVYRSYRPDVAFYVREAERSGGPVLELGVGTGRIAIAIASAEVDLVGVDISAGMLARARERIEKRPLRVRERIELHEGDMRSFELGRRFPLVIAPFNVMQHLYEDEDVRGTLSSVRRHLKSGGVFAFDVLMPDPRALARDPARFYKCRTTIHPKDGKRYDYAEAFDYDHARQIQTVTMRFTDPDDAERVFFSRLSQRQIFPRELRTLLETSGFEILSHDGGYDGEPLDETSLSQVVIARPRRKSS
jgi:SAM-dependent methyltransferase